MPKIDNSYFGAIIIDGEKFDSDVTVLPSGDVHTRQSSHEFNKAEFQQLLLHDPDVVIVGTGTAGLMKVDAAVEVAARLKGIELIVKPTAQALREFNKFAGRKKVAGVFHVTC